MYNQVTSSNKLRRSVSRKLSESSIAGTLDRFLRFNISGQQFVISRQLANKFSKSNLASNSFLEQFWDEELEAFYLDRDPVLFNSLLNYLRYNAILLPAAYNEPMLKLEMGYWKIPEHQHESLKEEMNNLERDFMWMEDRYLPPKEDDSRWKKFRFKVWCFLTDPLGPYTAHRRLSVANAAVTISLIIFYLILFGLSTTPEFRTLITYSNSNTTGNVNIADCENVKDCFVRSQPVEWLDVTLLCFLAFFLLDTSLRVLFCPNYRQYFKSLINWMDIIASLCVSVFMIFRMESIQQQYPSSIWTYTKIGLYAIQVLRVFKILQFATLVDGLMVMLLTMKASLNEIFVLITYLGTCLFLFSMLVTFAEIISGVGDDATDITDCMTGYWWAIVTMTTVGYGDYYPKSTAGRLVGACCVVVGYIMMGLPVAVIGGNFSKYWQYNNHRKKLMNAKLKFREKSANRVVPKV